MSILLALLTFLLILAISYIRRPKQQSSTPAWRKRLQPLRQGLEIPEEYCFHPCHTWLVNEGGGNVRVGLDGFVAQLFGAIEHMELPRLQRWVRQGQRLMTVSGAGVSVELLSPAEGTVNEINEEIVLDSGLLITDPYRRGWVARLKSPDIATDQKNLLRGPVVKSWMRNNFVRLNELISQLSPALAQDGGLPRKGLLAMVSPELQKKLIKEFLLTESLPIKP